MTTTVHPASDIPRPAAPTNHQTHPAASLSAVTSPKRLARIAGVLYLFVGIFGGFAEGYVEPKMYVAGDASATAGNVIANAGLVRLGVVSDLLDQTFFVFLALTLYVLLKHVHQSVARAMVVLVALAAGITCLNTVFLFEALRIATGAVDFSALGVAGSNAMVLLLLDAQHHGSSSRRSSLGCGWCHWGISPTGQGYSRNCWASCWSPAVSATCWTCSRRSWSPTLASGNRCTPSSSSRRQQSRKSRWSFTCWWLG